MFNEEALRSFSMVLENTHIGGHANIVSFVPDGNVMVSKPLTETSAETIKSNSEQWSSKDRQYIRLWNHTIETLQFCASFRGSHKIVWQHNFICSTPNCFRTNAIVF